MEKHARRFFYGVAFTLAGVSTVTLLYFALYLLMPDAAALVVWALIIYGIGTAYDRFDALDARVTSPGRP